MLAFVPLDYQSPCPPVSAADPLVVLVDGACKEADIKDSCPSGMLS